MTHSADEAGANQPLNQTQREALGSLVARIGRIESLLGQLAAEFGGMAVDLSDITNAAGATPISASPSQNKTPQEIFRPFSSAEQRITRSQVELEAISAKDRELPQRIQDIFLLTLQFFDSETKTRANPATDPSLKSIEACYFNGQKSHLSPPRRKPRDMPDYTEPKKWTKAVRAQAQRHQWTDTDHERRHQYGFHFDYVALPKGAITLVGYKLSYTKGPNGEAFDLNGQSCTSASVKVTVADGLVKQAELMRTEALADPSENPNKPIITIYEFATGRVKTMQGPRGYTDGYYPYPTSNLDLSYNSDEYRYEGVSGYLSGDDMLANLKSHIDTVCRLTSRPGH